MDRIYLTVDTDLSVDEILQHLTANQIVDYYRNNNLLYLLLLEVDAATMIAHLVGRVGDEGQKEVSA